MQVLHEHAARIRACGVVTMPRFDMVHALELVQDQRITRFFAVPPMVLGLAKHPAVDDYNLSSIKQIFSGAAPLGADLAAAAAARVGCEVVQGYGMTELSPVSHCTPEGQFRPGTSGRDDLQHRDPHRRPRNRRRPRCRRARRAAGAGPAGDEGLSQQSRRHRRDPRTPTAGCTPATWPCSTARATCR